MKEYGNPVKGMNMDLHLLNMSEDTYSFALNAMMEDNTGNGFFLQNDYSNLLGSVFNSGENILGKIYISELNYLILCTDHNRILLLSSKLFNDNDLNSFNYEKGSNAISPDYLVELLDIRELANSSCFNWNINNKVDIEYKITDSTLNLYFVDKGRNEDRYLYFNLNNLSIDESFLEIENYDAYNQPVYNTNIDCNKLKWNPDVSYPYITTTETEGGNLTAGVYQFLAGFSTSKGISLTNYKGSTNPFHLFTKTLTDKTDYNTGKAIILNISNLEIYGRYSYINIAVVKTINGVTTYELVATLPISNNISYTYTGDRRAITLNENDLFKLYPFYKSSNGIAKANNKLFKYGLQEYEKFNLQPIVNKIKTKWFTIAAEEGEYLKPEFAQDYRSGLRDEVVPHAIKFLLSNGEQTQVYPFIGRESTPYDREIINNKDVLNNIEECKDDIPKQRWEVYNTATVTNTSSHQVDKCEYKQYQEGEFAYWESTEKYPSDTNVWGSLANTPIRFPKYPDCLVSPIHSGNSKSKNIYGSKAVIYPIGIKIADDVNIDELLSEAVSSGLITQYQKDRIVGYKILRANRVGNKSILAKGYLSNVWNYNDKGKTIYYDNYGFNDLRRDPFIANQNLETFNGITRDEYRAEFFENNRYTFHSPDTSYTQPSLGNILKVENEIFGTSKGYFSESKQQGEYVVLGQLHYNFAILIGYLLTARLKLSEAQPASQGSTIGSAVGAVAGGVIGAFAGGIGAPLGAALGSGLGSIIGKLIGGNTSDDDYNDMYRLSMWISQTDRILELLQNTTPLQNYHWQYQSIGEYNNTEKVENNNFKQREIIDWAYLNSTRQQLPDTLFNHNLRESSVYLRLNDHIGYTKNIDNSKVSASFKDECLEDHQEVVSDISTFYASIKRNVLNQYGNIFSLEWLPTSNKLWNLNERAQEFGGDTYIGRHSEKRKISFFTSTTFRLPDRTDVYYEDYSNIGFPLYFFNTKYTELTEGASTTLKFLEGITNSVPLLAALNNIESPQSITAGVFDINRHNNQGTQLAISEMFERTLLNPYITTRPGKYYLDCSIDNFYRKLDDDYIEIQQKGGWWKNTFGDGKVEKYIPNVKLTFEGVKGKIYTYHYSVPYFICESDVNLDLRYAEGVNEKDFYPRISDLDIWMQPYDDKEAIKFDNYFTYNRSYSKQNHEELSLVTDINFYKNLNKTYNENRVIYSQDGAEVENSDFKDAYLYNNPLDSFDFSYQRGKLISIDSIESDSLLLRFTNGTGVIPNTQSLITQEGANISLGNGKLFNNFQEFSKTSLGYIGSQHTDMLNTEFGHIMVDALRGNVFNIASGGKSIDELTKDGMRNFFTENLPFKINKYFKDVDIDNSYAGIGIALSYDKRYKRFFLTKLDYIPLYNNIKYINKKFYIDDIEISLRDKRYFCNASFTVSYSFYTKSWTSFHSFTPNYYIDGINLFYSGLNSLDNNKSSIWIHNLTNKSYQVYYSKLYPFEVEASTKPNINNKIINNISFALDVKRNHNQFDVSYIDNISFNKAIVFNTYQNSGWLNLNLSVANDLYRNSQYPIKNINSTEIALKKNETLFSFNQFSDLTIKNNLPRFINTCNNVNKILNLKSIDYNNISVDNNYIRGDKVFVKLINDIHSEYKFVFKGLITDVTPSIR